MGLTRQRIAARILGPLRRRGRRVIWTPDFMGFGNLLYLLHWAHTARAVGHPLWVLTTPALDPWRTVFPELLELCLERDEVRWSDARIMPWSEAGRAALPPGFYDSITPLSPEEPFRDFISGYLLPGARRSMPRPNQDPHRLLVNVRRGDYYSHPTHLQQYGFAVAGYVEAAVRGSLAHQGPVRSVRVVSDDVGWCRDHLTCLYELDAEITFSDPGDTAVSNFFEIADARRLVITNSTFSYWGALLSNLLHPGSEADIWAPRFFDRTRHGGRSPLLDERWSIIESLPGGWDPPEAQG